MRLAVKFTLLQTNSFCVVLLDGKNIYAFCHLKLCKSFSSFFPFLLPLLHKHWLFVLSLLLISVLVSTKLNYLSKSLFTLFQLIFVLCPNILPCSRPNRLLQTCPCMFSAKISLVWLVFLYSNTSRFFLTVRSVLVSNSTKAFNICNISTLLTRMFYWKNITTFQSIV